MFSIADNYMNEGCFQSAPLCGRKTFGQLIREIDFTNYNEANKVTDLEYASQNDITFDEIKDAFVAFEERVCVPGFPEAFTQAYYMADATFTVFDRLMRAILEKQGVQQKAASDVIFHTFLALLRAGPNSSHLHLLARFHGCTPSILEHIKTLKEDDLRALMTALRIQFKYIPSDFFDEDWYAGLATGTPQWIINTLSGEQRKLVHKEILELHIYYHSTMPCSSMEINEKVDVLIRNMVLRFKDQNPFIGFEDTHVIKEQLTVIKNLACSENYVQENPLDQVAERTMKNITQALIHNEPALTAVFDHMMNGIVEMSKCTVAQKQGENLFEVHKELFKEMAENVKLGPSIIKSVVNMALEIIANGSMARSIEDVLGKALGEILGKVQEISAADTILVLKMVSSCLRSGRKKLVNEATKIVKNLWDIQTLDWKVYIEQAKDFLTAVGEIPRQTMQNDNASGIETTKYEYYEFTKTILVQLRKNKCTSQLQPNLLTFYFNCMSVSTPLKTELAAIVSNGGYLGLSPKDGKMRILLLQKCEGLFKNEKLPWSNIELRAAINSVLTNIIELYEGDGKNVTKTENELFVSIFKICGSDADDSVAGHFYEEDENDLGVNGMVYSYILTKFIHLHQQTSTLECIMPIIPDILRWAKLAVKQKQNNMAGVLFSLLSLIGMSAPTSMKDSLPQLMNLMLDSGRTGEMFAIVQQLYPHNTKPVHIKLPDMFDRLDELIDQQRQIYFTLFHMVSQAHADVFNKSMISKLFLMYPKVKQTEKSTILGILKFIAEKNPSVLSDFLPQLRDDKMFKADTMTSRSGIIACIGGINKKLFEQSVDYLMKFASHTDPTVVQSVIVTVSVICKNHPDYMQKYRGILEKLEKTSTIPQVKEKAHEILLILEGKSVENIAKGLEQQQEDIADLDVKVDTTIGTVITIGGKVVEHDKEIGQLGEGLERVEERVDDVEEDLGETKIKVEEIDNKTMSNAPKWSRDLTKLMNPSAKNDWRLLASRLGYSNDDIRGWATQHDPCMALLSEWYATHKTSEASYGVLTALTEMNRMDGVVIVENAMKAAEGVVEDEEFEYPSPPPVFISYQWGIQNEVKLLKQHLNMAGYECWLDVGQMGGGDKLFAKIDNGIRGAKIVICCVTERYAKSPNCNREVNLSVNLNKPIIPLLMEKMSWPPIGSMGPIFSEYLFIRFFQRDGEETKMSDQRYWPIPKFQELLMQLNFYTIPDQKMVKKEYAKWWAPIAEDIVIDKSKGKKPTMTQNANGKEVVKNHGSPLVFLSYQWGKQPQVQALYKRITSMGYTVWMDIYQMGGGDSLYDKIDKGVRGCKAVVSCVTQKYTLSANCRREVSLADALKKPIIPVLMESIKWPPDGPMSMVFTEILYINCYRSELIQTTWKGAQFDELIGKLEQFVPLNVSKDHNDQGIENRSVVSGGKQPASPVKNLSQQQLTPQDGKMTGAKNSKKRNAEDEVRSTEKPPKAIVAPATKEHNSALKTKPKSHSQPASPVKNLSQQKLTPQDGKMTGAKTTTKRSAEDEVRSTEKTLIAKVAPATKEHNSAQKTKPKSQSSPKTFASNRPLAESHSSSSNASSRTANDIKPGHDNSQRVEQSLKGATQPKATTSKSCNII